ncbi:MAG: hypothetical protein AMXMBFR58_27100 [Phycisphaerae bacterium]|nr:hypothetical protein [Phycisphaerales bacterium]
MSTRELVELAQLDAMGLLDEQEAREFEVAFAAAPEEIREQIRKEQSRLCVLEPVLPEVSPPEHLRGKVLASVHQAIVASIVESAPAEPSADTVPGREPAMPAASIPAIVRHDAGRSIGSDTRRRGTAKFWRSTSIAFAAAAVVLAITTLRLQGMYDDVIRQNSTSKSVEAVGQLFGDVSPEKFLFDSNTERTVLTATADVPEGSEWKKVRAAVWHNADWKQAKLLCQNLPSSNGESYELVVLDEEGQVERVLGTRLQPTAGGVMAFDVGTQFRPQTDRLALRVLTGAMTQATIILEHRPTLG